LNWLQLGCFAAAALSLLVLLIDWLQFNWLVLGCFAAAALPMVASNRKAANELAGMGLLRCRCAVAALPLLVL
jgi:hypothetical protein